LSSAHRLNDQHSPPKAASARPVPRYGPCQGGCPPQHSYLEFSRRLTTRQQRCDAEALKRPATPRCPGAVPSHRRGTNQRDSKARKGSKNNGLNVFGQRNRFLASEGCPKTGRTIVITSFSGRGTDSSPRKAAQKRIKPERAMVGRGRPWSTMVDHQRTRLFITGAGATPKPAHHRNCVAHHVLCCFPRLRTPAPTGLTRTNGVSSQRGRCRTQEPRRGAAQHCSEGRSGKGGGDRKTQKTTRF